MSDNATYPMKIAALIEQAWEQGTPIMCPECGHPIMPLQKIQFDHRQAKGRGGTNTVANLRAIHAETDGPFNCHARKTTGGSAKATTLGSDVFEIAKTNRMATRADLLVQKKPLDQPREPRRGFGGRIVK